MSGAMCFALALLCLPIKISFLRRWAWHRLNQGQIGSRFLTVPGKGRSNESRHIGAKGRGKLLSFGQLCISPLSRTDYFRQSFPR